MEGNQYAAQIVYMPLAIFTGEGCFDFLSSVMSVRIKRRILLYISSKSRTMNEILQKMQIDNIFFKKRRKSCYFYCKQFPNEK